MREALRCCEISGTSKTVYIETRGNRPWLSGQLPRKSEMLDMGTIHNLSNIARIRDINCHNGACTEDLKDHI